MSTNPIERIKTHNQGRGARYALEQGPFSLVYISKPYSSKKEARAREVQVKDWSQEKKQKLISGEWQ